MKRSAPRNSCRMVATHYLRWADNSDSQTMLTLKIRTRMGRMSKIILHGMTMALLKRQWNFWFMLEAGMMILMERTVKELMVFLNTDAIKDEGFQYSPHPTILQEVLPPGTYVCVIFTARWERGRAQESRKIPLKQRREAKDMDDPFVVKYDDWYWLHNMCGADS